MRTPVRPACGRLWQHEGAGPNAVRLAISIPPLLSARFRLSRIGSGLGLLLVTTTVRLFARCTPPVASPPASFPPTGTNWFDDQPPEGAVRTISALPEKECRVVKAASSSRRP